MLQHADAQRHTLHTPAKRTNTKVLNVRGNIQGDVLCVTASTTLAAGSDGFGGDAWPMETKALQCGDGSEAVGSLVIWTPPLVPTPSANTERSGSSPNDRNCTRQVAQVVFCLSAKGHDSASQRMQGGVC